MFALLRPALGKSRLVRGLAALAIALLTLPAPVTGQSVTIGPIVRVEQDWEIDVGIPAPEICCPQIYFQVTPRVGEAINCQFLINYCDLPRFAAGGLQVQIWNGPDNLATNDYMAGQAVLRTDNETIKFTLFTQVDSGNLNFGVTNIQSVTWGNASGALYVTTPYNYLSLPLYSTADTMNNSGILWGSNRIQGIKLNVVRKYDASGNTVTEAAQTLIDNGGSGGN